MAPSLLKPPNASKFNLANAGKNLSACRLVKPLMSIILPFCSYVKMHLTFSHMPVAFKETNTLNITLRGNLVYFILEL